MSTIVTCGGVIKPRMYIKRYGKQVTVRVRVRALLIIRVGGAGGLFISVLPCR